MTNVNPPPQLKIPEKFFTDPETRSFFEQQRQILFQLWQRTGGNVDDVGNATDHVSDVSIHTEDNLLAHLAGVETFTGAKTFDELTTFGDNLVSDTDSTDDLGTTGVRWKELFVDGITATNETQIVQILNTQIGTSSTGTTILPNDNTIPVITEGDEYMTLAITPRNTSNILLISVVANLAHDSDTSMCAALFQDTTTDALAAAKNRISVTNGMGGVVFTHKMTAGTTSSTTFRVRAGSAAGATTTFNGQSGGDFYGGIVSSSITITEIKV